MKSKFEWFDSESNLDIKTVLKKYQLTYNDILPFLGNFSHIQRISEELSKPLPYGRKRAYLEAIEKAKEKKRKEMEEIYGN